MDVSIVIPVYNEEDSIGPLFESIEAVINHLKDDVEVVFVNDGSTDGSAEVLDALAARDPRVTVVHFRRNFGQTAAMTAGFKHASGSVIVTMDADLQNDPTDIPKMLDKLNEGYDLVHGWRRDRQDAFLNRRLPSIIANWLISRVTGFPVKDLGCTLKAIRREIADDLRLYGEMHRFIPILAHWQGARCVELVTKHHARKFGQTKYGISRTFRVILDLITVKYLTQYSTSPMRLFGTVGFFCGSIGFASGLAVFGMKLVANFDVTGNPFLYISLFSMLLGLQFFSLGMLGEVSARIYYESQDRAPYNVRRVVNFAAPLPASQEKPSRAA